MRRSTQIAVGKDAGAGITINEALATARHSIDAVDARVLLRHALNASNETLATQSNQPLPIAQANLFYEWVERRSRGEPVAYLVGSREFYGLTFAVDRSVLIPRPETELLVDVALENLPENAPRTVLDLGTGCGAIAVALAHQRPLARVCGVDLAEAALLLARANARRLLPEERGSPVSFLKGDWYQPVSERRFDLIVSNPPYVAEADPHLGEGDLRFEPRAALTAGAHGLAALQEIISGAPQRLNSNGWFFCEHGYDQEDPVREFLHGASFADISCRRDLAGIGRVSGGHWRG